MILGEKKKKKKTPKFSRYGKEVMTSNPLLCFDFLNFITVILHTKLGITVDKIQKN